jgi:hypothetical protein
VSFCTAAQFLVAYDTRRIRQLLSDSGTPLTEGEVESSDVLQQLLDEAADLVYASVMVGKRYTADDLTTLAASTTSGFFLRRLNADLAFGLIVARRGVSATDITKLAPMFAAAHNYLNDLRNGILLFPKIDDSRAEAGVPKAADLSTNPYSPVSWVQQTSGRVFPFGSSPSYSGNC